MTSGIYTPAAMTASERVLDGLLALLDAARTEATHAKTPGASSAAKEMAAFYGSAIAEIEALQRKNKAQTSKLDRTHMMITTANEALESVPSSPAEARDTLRRLIRILDGG